MKTFGILGLVVSALGISCLVMSKESNSAHPPANTEMLNDLNLSDKTIIVPYVTINGEEVEIHEIYTRNQTY